LDRSKSKDRFRVNNRIRAREVRVIGEDGSQVGVISIGEALSLAEEQNLDLVEVAPGASPPVCRLMDYGKFRYEQSKKEREARKHQKQIGMKEVRLRPKTDTHDLDVKANQARRFLTSGDKVKFTVRFRGRELAHTNIGREMLDHLIEALRDIAVVEQKPTLESRALSLVLAPNMKAIKASSQKSKQDQSQQQKPSQENKKKSSRPVDDKSLDTKDVDDEDVDDEDVDDEDVDDEDNEDVDNEDGKEVDK
jgi:translation initiation factor IF-3